MLDRRREPGEVQEQVVVELRGVAAVNIAVGVVIEGRVVGRQGLMEFVVVAGVDVLVGIDVAVEAEEGLRRAADAAAREADGLAVGNSGDGRRIADGDGVAPVGDGSPLKLTAHCVLLDPATAAQLNVGTVPVQPDATATVNTLGSVAALVMLTGVLNV